ncbi:hypothetical protein KM043_012593 [Ampulex compressa]|nr:hypothetical protein KM043_012593 [Ampulex compressa]
MEPPGLQWSDSVITHGVSVQKLGSFRNSRNTSTMGIVAGQDQLSLPITRSTYAQRLPEASQNQANIQVTRYTRDYIKRRILVGPRPRIVQGKSFPRHTSECPMTDIKVGPWLGAKPPTTQDRSDNPDTMQGTTHQTSLESFPDAATAELVNGTLQSSANRHSRKAACAGLRAKEPGDFGDETVGEACSGRILEGSRSSFPHNSNVDSGRIGAKQGLAASNGRGHFSLSNITSFCGKSRRVVQMIVAH